MNDYQATAQATTFRQFKLDAALRIRGATTPTPPSAETWTVIDGRPVRSFPRSQLFTGNWSGRRSRVMRSGCFGQPGTALGQRDEGFEEVVAVFGGGGQVASDRAELLGSGQGP